MSPARSLELPFRAGDRIQVRTKTNRHQLYNVWLTVKKNQRNGSDSIQAVPDTNQYTTWRLPVDMVIKAERDGKPIMMGQPATCAPVTNAASAPDRDPKLLHLRVKLLEKTVEDLQDQISAIRNLLAQSHITINTK